MTRPLDKQVRVMVLVSLTEPLEHLTYRVSPSLMNVIYFFLSQMQDAYSSLLSLKLQIMSKAHIQKQAI